MQHSEQSNTLEYRTVFDGYRDDPRFHDWTDLETARDEAEAFVRLGCTDVRLLVRPKGSSS